MASKVSHQKTAGPQLLLTNINAKTWCFDGQFHPCLLKNLIRILANFEMKSINFGSRNR